MQTIRREQLEHMLELQETGSEPLNFLKDGDEDISYQYTQKLHNVPGLTDAEADRFRERILTHTAVQLEAELSPAELETGEWAFTVLVDDPDIDVQLDVIETVFESVLDHDVEDLSTIRGGVAGGRIELELTEEPTEPGNELDQLGLDDLVEELLTPPAETPSFVDVTLEPDDEVLTVRTDLEPGEVAVAIGMDVVDFEPDRFPAVVYRTDVNPSIYTAFDGTVLYPAADEAGPDRLRAFLDRIRAPTLEVPESLEIECRTVGRIVNG